MAATAPRAKAPFPKRIQMRNVGQLKEADVTLGELTLIVGPQATGKSIFLQWIKLLKEHQYIKNELEDYNFDWGGQWQGFADLYFGEGMHKHWLPGKSHVQADRREFALHNVGKWPKQKNLSFRYPWWVFCIPAQRVMSMQDGSTRTFESFSVSDPYVLRSFAQNLHNFTQYYIADRNVIFPDRKLMKPEVTARFTQDVFGGFELRMEKHQMRKRMVLKQTKSGVTLPYMVWSAGQREFVPLLLGLYMLAERYQGNRHFEHDLVIIEEPEMGMHPDAIGGIMCAVFDLLHRGYRVCLSTHSPYVLDFIWAIRFMQEKGGSTADVLDLLRMEPTPYSKQLAKSVLSKDYRSYFFRRSGMVKDISTLDTGDADPEIAGWGGLTGGSGLVGDVVARLANRNALSAKKK